MSNDEKTHNRRSIRLKYYDYSEPGAYFVTVVTQNRKSIFGNVVNGKMDLNEYGKIVDYVWHDLPNHVDGIMYDKQRVLKITCIEDASENVENPGLKMMPFLC